MIIRYRLLAFSWAFTLVGFVGLWLYQAVMFDPYEQISQKLSLAIAEQQVQLNDVRMFLAGNTNLPKDIFSSSFPIRAYRNGQLTFWNSNDQVPDYDEVDRNDPLFLTLDDSYLIQKLSMADGGGAVTEIIGYLPIQQTYEINNQYLTDRFNPAFFGSRSVEISKLGINVLTVDVPLHILIDDQGNHKVFQSFLEILFVAITLLTIGVVSGLLPWRFRPVWSFAIFFTAVGTTRLTQLWLFPLDLLFKNPLFDPVFYVSAWYLPTVGDLIINLSLLFILAYHLSKGFFNPNRWVRGVFISGWKQTGTLLVLSTSTLIGAKGIFDLTTNILSNSQVDLDITATIEFSWLKIVAYFAILVAGLIYFQINYIFYSYFIKLPLDRGRKWLVLLAGVGVYYLIFPDHAIYIVTCQFLSWVVSVNLRNTFSLSRVRYITLFHLMWIAILVAAISSYAIYKQYEEDVHDDKQRFSSNLLLGNDVLAEYYMGQVIGEIRSDPFIRTRFINEVLATQQTADRIRRYFPFYLDKYDARIYLYDKKGDPYGYTTVGHLTGWTHTIDRFSKTSNPNIVYDQDPVIGRHKYISHIKMETSQGTLGHIVIEMTLKKYISRSVFPALLMETSPQANRTDYDYAVYHSGNLQFSHGDFPFQLYLQEDLRNKLVTTGSGSHAEQAGIDFYYSQLENGSEIFIVSQLYAKNRIITNISFQFILALVLIGLFFLAIRMYRPMREFSLINKIQWYTGLAFIIPILIISIAILNVLNTSYQDEINRNYQKRARNVSENLVSVAARFSSNTINRDRFVGELEEAANLVQADLMIYSIDGGLQGTNRSEVFDLQLLSRQIDPRALDFILSNPAQTIVLDDQIGLLDFKTVYTGIISYEDGTLLGIVAMPFFNFKNHLNRQQIEVFNNLITIFTVIFIVTVVLGNIGLRQVIYPIRVIAERLRRINYLEDTSEPLTYGADDEIGLLVKEYNNMLSKLSESRKTLAKVQKESAWKEIARQVAHEIKNPLTPMKLKIQQMQRSHPSGSKHYLALNSLLMQVDALSSIADSFSAFAQMPAPENELFDLSALVENIADLHQQEDVSIQRNIEKELEVYADPKLMSQILNNLMINAIQSIGTDKKEIKILFGKSGRKLELKIADNGEGIPEDLKDKIFKPYFSTKEKGSGIGLALAKKGIEQAQGNIWFEPNPGGGTIFYITLPVP